MNIFDKHGYTFVAGLFYQSVLSNKKTINFKQITEMTGKDVYAITTKIRPTAGFCSRQDLGLELSQKLPRIAALGIYIVECVDLSSKVEDCILCFKFDDDKYGYVIFVNGTISPDDGEYITDLNGMKLAVIQKIKDNTNIRSIYATSEVYSVLANEVSLNEINFKKMGVDTKNSNQFRYTSEDLFWSKKRLRTNFKKALLRYRLRPQKIIIKAGMLGVAIMASGFGMYYLLHDDIPVPVSHTQPSISGVVGANQMITTCFKDTDPYFKDLISWSLSGLICTATSRVLTFTASAQFTNSLMALDSLKQIISQGNVLNHDVIQMKSNKMALIESKYSLINVDSKISPAIIKETLINLSRLSHEYGFRLDIPLGNKSGINRKFSLHSTVSPMFLYKHHVLDNVLIKSIRMQLNLESGLYSWIIEGSI